MKPKRYQPLERAEHAGTEVAPVTMNTCLRALLQKSPEGAGK